MLVCSAARMSAEESERAFVRPFILPGKVIRVEWFKSSSLDENIFTFYFQWLSNNHYSFFFLANRVIYFWNKLPNQVKNRNSGENFKIKSDDIRNNWEKKTTFLEAIWLYIMTSGDSSLFLLLVPPPPSVNFSSQPVVCGPKVSHHSCYCVILHCIAQIDKRTLHGVFFL